MGDEQILRALEQRVRVVWRERKRRVEHRAIVADPADVGGHRANLPALAIEPPHAASFSASVNDVRVDRVGDDVAELVAGDGIPIEDADVPVVAAIARANRSAVLLHPVYPIRPAVVGRQVVELTSGLVYQELQVRPPSSDVTAPWSLPITIQSECVGSIQRT